MEQGPSGGGGGGVRWPWLAITLEDVPQPLSSAPSGSSSKRAPFPQALRRGQIIAVLGEDNDNGLYLGKGGSSLTGNMIKYLLDIEFKCSKSSLIS